eukprot:2242856-Rhodomonas_salina.3
MTAATGRATMASRPSSTPKISLKRHCSGSPFLRANDVKISGLDSRGSHGPAPTSALSRSSLLSALSRSSAGDGAAADSARSAEDSSRIARRLRKRALVRLFLQRRLLILLRFLAAEKRKHAQQSFTQLEPCTPVSLISPRTAVGVMQAHSVFLLPPFKFPSPSGSGGSRLRVSSRADSARLSLRLTVRPDQVTVLLILCCVSKQNVSKYR